MRALPVRHRACVEQHHALALLHGLSHALRADESVLAVLERRRRRRRVQDCICRIGRWGKLGDGLVHPVARERRKATTLSISAAESLSA